MTKFEKKIEYKKYSNEQKTVQRRIFFEKEVAEDVNKIIAIFNSEFNGIRINNSTFINIVLRDFFTYLKTLDENEAMEILKNNLIAYTLEDEA
ncbi:hypothetical protein [Methanobrevibacter sp.]|uniref:hypothetical protein n=1 Tax=Methanobrevibacter sp. TaxID=66852 RepID=UPI00388F2FC6